MKLKKIPIPSPKELGEPIHNIDMGDWYGPVAQVFEMENNTGHVHFYMDAERARGKYALMSKLQKSVLKLCTTVSFDEITEEEKTIHFPNTCHQ